MKRKATTLILISVVSFSMSSCSNVETDNNVHESHSSSPANSDSSKGLHLDKGEKWQVPNDMMSIVKIQQQMVIDYQAEGDTTFLKLGNGLDSLCTSLIQSCTMTGEAHNVLHEWLIPYWTTIDSVNASGNSQEAAKFIDQLADHFNVFDTYFN